MSDDELPPELDDFQTELKTIHVNKPVANKSNLPSEDYTKVNTRHIQDEQKLAKQVQKVQITQKELQKQVQKTKPKSDFGGFKKGFFSSGPSKPSPKPITQIKGSTKNPLQIKQVQQAMKMNNYLDQTRNQWMTNNFLEQVTKNQKVNKLFSNPQYMKAIDLFKTNPKQAMVKYGQNKQFMEGFQEFCKLMGTQFQGLSQQQKQQQLAKK